MLVELGVKLIRTAGCSIFKIAKKNKPGNRVFIKGTEI